ncbi:unnamed protein product [Colias eurytheme]|nr:unnamed protein product [Colias eurytheme]
MLRAQDCRTSGQRCGSHEQCCGGCCYEGHCIDTYRSCLQSFNVCRDHVCIGEENCVEFRPPGCLRCEPLPICRT